LATQAIPLPADRRHLGTIRIIAEPAAIKANAASASQMLFVPVKARAPPATGGVAVL